MIWLVLAAAELAGTAVLARRPLRLGSPVAFLLAAYLLASAEVVALTEVLSLPGLVYAGGYAVGEAVLLAAALAAWHRRGRPRPPLPRLAGPGRAPCPPGRRRARARRRLRGRLRGRARVRDRAEQLGLDDLPPLAGRRLVPAAPCRVPLLAHRARERLPAEQRDRDPLHVRARRARHGCGRDPAARRAGVLLGVYGCSRRLGFARPAALLASLLTATLTEITLQSVTTQNDLVAASFALAAAYLALGGTRAEPALAGLAAGLALGTKATTAPALALVALLVLTRRPWRTRLATLAAASAIGFAAVGFYGYGLNLVHDGSLLGDPVA